MIFIIVSSIVGILLGFLLYPRTIGKYLSKKSESKTPSYVNPYLRRGVYRKTYTNKLSQCDFDIEYELGEVSKTNTKSKVEVITFKVISNFQAIRDIYSPGESGSNMVIEPVNNTWVDTSEIDWIEGSIEESRDLKINSILNI